MPSLSNVAAQNIQRLIANGTYASGKTLPSQRDLAETLGISRACLREAISMLEALGLVRSHAGKGVFADVRFIQRVRTTGGIAPTGACTASNLKSEARVPYTATYLFFR